MTNWRENIEAQIAEATEHGDPLDMVYIEVHAPVLQALLDDRKRLRAEFVESCKGQHEVEILLQGRIKRLRAALERIATKPPVNEEYGNQGYDADEMQAMADAALQEGE